jgi:hypothetical protein
MGGGGGRGEMGGGRSTEEGVPHKKSMAGFFIALYSYSLFSTEGFPGMLVLSAFLVRQSRRLIPTPLNGGTPHGQISTNRSEWSMSRVAMESRRARVVGWLLWASICGLVCGCASSVSAPRSLRQAAAQRLEHANKYLGSGSYLGAYEAIQYDLRSSDPQIREPAWQLVNNSPQFFTHVLADVDTTVTQVHSPGAASLAKALLLRLTEAPDFEQTRVHQLQAKLDARVTAGNLDSSLPFVLTDNLRWFSSLETLEGMRVIFERSVAALANTSPGMKLDRDLLSATLTYVESRGPGSDEYRYLGSKPRHNFVYFSADVSRPYRFIVTPQFTYGGFPPAEASTCRCVA